MKKFILLAVLMGFFPVAGFAGLYDNVTCRTQCELGAVRPHTGPGGGCYVCKVGGLRCKGDTGSKWVLQSCPAGSRGTDVDGDGELKDEEHGE